VPTLRVLLIYWLPPLLWMAVMFTASGDAKSYEHSSLLVEPFLHWLFPHMTQEHVETIHHIFRKCCHVAEYAVLALLLLRALRQMAGKDAPSWSWCRAGLVLGLVFVCAASDEFHQRFVHSRTSLVSDVFIDTAGGAISLIAIGIVRLYRRPRPEN
jgi:VanZ family protein